MANPKKKWRACFLTPASIFPRRKNKRKKKNLKYVRYRMVGGWKNGVLKEQTENSQLKLSDMRDFGNIKKRAENIGSNVRC